MLDKYLKPFCVALAALLLSACASAPDATLIPTTAASAPDAALVPTSVASEPQGSATRVATVAAVPTSAAPAASATGAPSPTQAATALPTATSTATPRPVEPLSIDAMRARSYPGSDLTIEQTLPAGGNYQRYYVSYLSEGLKIYAMLTVPNGAKPATGWPVVIFNHGFIPPSVYRTTERYIAYVDAFARSGYIVLKSDYRGHDKSEGLASGGYGSPDYTVDVLNGLSSIKRYKDADPNRIGMWGHSMGGQVTLRSIVVVHDIKAAVIWSGVVASYPDMLATWNVRPGAAAPSGESRGWRGHLVSVYGSPQDNPQFWASISPNSYLAEGVPPVQLHHDTGDGEVPLSMSEGLARELQAAGQPVELYTYPGDDHNISAAFNLAMSRSLAFMDKYVKNR